MVRLTGTDGAMEAGRKHVEVVSRYGLAAPLAESSPIPVWLPSEVWYIVVLSYFNDSSHDGLVGHERNCFGRC